MKYCLFRMTLCVLLVLNSLAPAFASEDVDAGKQGTVEKDGPVTFIDFDRNPGGGGGGSSGHGRGSDSPGFGSGSGNDGHSGGSPGSGGGSGGESAGAGGGSGRDFFNSDHPGSGGERNGGHRETDDERRQREEQRFLKEKAGQFAQNMSGLAEKLLKRQGDDQNQLGWSDQNTRNGVPVDPDIKDPGPGGVNDVLKDAMGPRLGSNTELIYTGGITAPEHPVKREWKSQGPFREILDDLFAKFESAHPENAQGQLAKAAGEYALGQADSAETAGDGEGANGYVALAKGLLDIAIGMTPVVGVVRDAYEAIFGQNLLTGEKLSNGQRFFAIASVATVGILGGVGKGAAILERMGARFATSAEARQGSKWIEEFIGDMENVTFHSGEEMNRFYITKGWQSPYKSEGIVIRGVKKSGFSKVRAHVAGNPTGAWLAGDPWAKDLSRIEYADKYSVSLENVEEISRADIPPMTPVELSVAGKNNMGNGDGIQIQILSKPQSSWFTKIREFMK